MTEFIIKQINLQFYKLQLCQPIVTASQVIRDRTGIIIQVIAQNGKFGLGESSPLAGFEMETIIHTSRSLKRIQEALIGEAIATVTDITNLLTPYNLPPAANHGIELALLNLLAAHQDKSLAQLLHPHHRLRISVNALIGQVSPDIAAQKARYMCQEGYKCLKIKVGDEQDLSRVQAVRAAATATTNQPIQIRLDANQAWTVDQAIAKLRAFTDLDIEYVEQPVKANDLQGMAEVAKNVEIAIAADEAVKNLTALEQIISSNSARVAILKPMALGGILTAQKAAKLAISSGLDVVFTTTLDGAIARLGAIHLAAMPEINRACGLAATELFATQDLLTTKTSVMAGAITV